MDSLEGTLTGGKKFASGSVQTGTTSTNIGCAIVRGLNFRPRVIKTWVDLGGGYYEEAFYHEGFNDGKSLMLSRYTSHSDFWDTPEIYNDGFKIYAAHAWNHNVRLAHWEAYE